MPADFSTEGQPWWELGSATENAQPAARCGVEPTGHSPCSQGGVARNLVGEAERNQEVISSCIVLCLVILNADIFYEKLQKPWVMSASPDRVYFGSAGCDTGARCLNPRVWD